MTLTGDPVTDGHVVNNVTNKVVTTADTRFTEAGTTIIGLATDAAFQRLVRAVAWRYQQT